MSADERRQIPHRTKVGLDGATLALDRGLLDLEVGKGLCLDRELVGEAVALGGRGVEKVDEPHAPTLLAEGRNVSSCRRMRPRDAQR